MFPLLSEFKQSSFLCVHIHIFLHLYNIYIIFVQYAIRFQIFSTSLFQFCCHISISIIFIFDRVILRALIFDERGSLCKNEYQYNYFGVKIILQITQSKIAPSNSSITELNPLHCRH